MEIPFLEFKRYSDLSAVEGIVGKGEGEWESEDTGGVQVGVKNRERVYSAGRIKITKGMRR